MSKSPVWSAKSVLCTLLPDAAVDAYRMVRWQISARSLLRGANRWENLKSLALRQRAKGAETYPHFLRGADAGLRVPKLCDVRFVGNGFGDWNLNLYRAGNLDGVPVFEKIFLSGSDPLRKLSWYHETVLPALGGAIDTPPIVRKIEGNFLTAVYFPFLNLDDPVSAEALLPVAKSLQDAVAGFHWSGDDPIIDDFRRDALYAEHRDAFLRIMASNGRDASRVMSVEEWLRRAEVPHLFNHGDLSPENVLARGVLLDFDHCGYYPAGYDCGAALRYAKAPEGVGQLESLIEQDLAPGCSAAQAAIMFFSLIFYSIGVATKSNDQLEEAFLLALWDRVQERLAAC